MAGRYYCHRRCAHIRAGDAWLQAVLFPGRNHLPALGICENPVPVLHGRYPLEDSSFKNVALSGAVAAAHILILVASRDLGSALIFFAAYVFLVFFATGKYRYLLGRGRHRRCGFLSGFPDIQACAGQSTGLEGSLERN